ncbi:MAG: VWA domain-containing protein [Candidatus Krumholzibacteriota bacterium]|nr:VWA domain-containing protein [Candidatus Krumholzibacteriota bacterium]
MSFGDPRWLPLLWALPAVLVLLAVAARWRERARDRLMSATLFARLTPGLDPARRRWKAFLFLLGLAAALIALPRPQIGSELAEVRRRGLDVIVALDTSRSMLAEDLRPNRFAAAKREVEDLFRLLRGNRLGLVTFAGESFTSCPLTLDAEAASLFLDGVSTSTIPVPGTNLEKAIRRALTAFRSEERRFKVLVLVTDGESHEGDAVAAARAAAEQGVVIFTIGIGTPDGYTLPLRDAETGALRENLRDREGRPVFSRLDRTMLQRVAAVTGGAYYESSGANLELDHLRETIAGMEARELTGRQARRPIERYQLFAALALAALALESVIGERRREEERWTGRF